jgi:hypothetical protein
MSEDVGAQDGPFTGMASRIKHNIGYSVFGGAFVIVPPEGAGEIVSTLVLDVQQDPIQFWRLVMEKAAATVSKLEDKARSQSAFGGPNLR